jgi:hypothetical protein
MGTVAFLDHTIDGSYDGAYAVYATDADGDGDVDVLGAALSADEITWWENDPVHREECPSIMARTWSCFVRGYLPDPDNR